ncbi:hypothetical protein E2C01_007731 [Portunus trituberculatus]|uniref:Uncharacterized protein n=1 Tax=Portunus trituberculatus TaxID=210409 RepID=A0A5B7D174_PORTR|nr:hypothetical protein [Portunus trituberculatus]
MKVCWRNGQESVGDGSGVGADGSPVYIKEILLLGSGGEITLCLLKYKVTKTRELPVTGGIKSDDHEGKKETLLQRHEVKTSPCHLPALTTHY